jgi:hypothetical protein
LGSFDLPHMCSSFLEPFGSWGGSKRPSSILSHRFSYLCAQNIGSLDLTYISTGQRNSSNRQISGTTA